MKEQKVKQNNNDSSKNLPQTQREAPISIAKKLMYTNGITAIWTEEESKTGIINGLKRKESYETSGSLIKVRFFGSWNYCNEMLDYPNFLDKAQEIGVTMGETLKEKPLDAKAPTFIVWAEKDPNSNNLERIQIIKGWYANDSVMEKTYDVVIASQINDSKKTGDGKLSGKSSLRAVWTDPDFIPSQQAIYYARILEIPTLAKNIMDVELEPNIDSYDKVQQKAWTSPIYYTTASEKQ